MDEEKGILDRTICRKAKRHDEKAFVQGGKSSEHEGMSKDF